MTSDDTASELSQPFMMMPPGIPSNTTGRCPLPETPSAFGGEVLDDSPEKDIGTLEQKCAVPFEKRIGFGCFGFAP